MGVTIKKEMTTDKFREGTQMSTKITKEATGMDLITPISGAAKSRTGPNREESTPKPCPQAGQQKAQGDAPEGEQDGAPEIPVGDELQKPQQNRG